MLLRWVLRRHLEVGTGVLKRVLRRGGCYRRRLEGASKQKHALSQSTTPFVCTLEGFCVSKSHVETSSAASP